MPVISSFPYIFTFFSFPHKVTWFKEIKELIESAKPLAFFGDRGKRCPVPQENTLIPTDFNQVQCIKYNPMPVFYRSAVHNRQ